MLEAQRPRIEHWLKAERPLRLVRVHELLAREGVEVSYTTLRRFAHDELGYPLLELPPWSNLPA